MRLQALVLCADDQILRVLRRVLSDLEIVIDHCADSDTAIHKLTRQRYEAVIVDCSNEKAASQVLRSARTAPCNKRAVAVAILDGEKAMNSAFDLGAHFVLYKPLSNERAKTSFRAARALMKCERRRNTRIPVEIPVSLLSKQGSQQDTVTSDISEGGIAVKLPASAKFAGGVTVKLTLPGSGYQLDCSGEVAWANSTRQAGIRFMDLSADATEQIKKWLESNSPDMEKDDPPVACKLTDLSPGGSYLETSAPFPVNTRVVLTITVNGKKGRAVALVRVSHPEKGMGIAFLQSTAEQKEQVDNFIQTLIQSEELPEIFVQPEGMEAAADAGAAAAPGASSEDPLLDLFSKGSTLSTQSFLAELRKQRNGHAEVESAPVA